MSDNSTASTARIGQSTEDASGLATPWLGWSIQARLGWHARLASRAPERSVGFVARRGRRFSSAIGRSLAARSALGIRSAISGRVDVTPASSAEAMLVEPPALPRLAATRAAALAAELARQALARTRRASSAWVAPGIARGAGHDQASVAALRPGTLPRAALAPSAWGSAGPGGFMARLRAEALPVRSLPDVVAVGDVLTTREARHSDASKARPVQPRAPRPSLSSLARRAAGRTDPPAGDARLRGEGAPAGGGSQQGRSSAPGGDSRSGGVSPSAPGGDSRSSDPQGGDLNRGGKDAGAGARSETRTGLQAGGSSAIVAAGSTGTLTRRSTGVETGEAAGGAVLLAERLAAAPAWASWPAHVAMSIGEGLSASGPRWVTAGAWGRRRRAPTTTAGGAPLRAPDRARASRGSKVMSQAMSRSAPEVASRSASRSSGRSTAQLMPGLPSRSAARSEARSGLASPRPARRLGDRRSDPGGKVRSSEGDVRAVSQAPPLTTTIRHLQFARDRAGTRPVARRIPPLGGAPPARGALSPTSPTSALLAAPASRPSRLARAAGEGEEIRAPTAGWMALPFASRLPVFRAAQPAGALGETDVAGLRRAAGVRTAADRRRAAGTRQIMGEQRAAGARPAPGTEESGAAREDGTPGTTPGTAARPTPGTARVQGNDSAPFAVGGARSARARRLVAELARRAPDPVVALPPRLEPLARALGGAGAFELRAGPASAAALAVAGRPAATIGRIVHLARRPDTAPASVGIVAHELVHASQHARGSRRPGAPAAGAVPRFFHDDAHDHEEGLARRIGSLVRELAASDAAPLVPAASFVGWRGDAPGNGAAASSPLGSGAGASGAAGGSDQGQGRSSSAWVRARGGGGSPMRVRPPNGALIGTPGVPGAGPVLGGAGPVSGDAGASGLSTGLERARREDAGLAALLERARAAGLGSVTGGRLASSSRPGSAVARFEGALGAVVAGAAGGILAGEAGSRVSPGLLPVPLQPGPAPVATIASQLGKKGASVVEPTPPTVQPSSAPGAAEILEWIVEHVERRVLDELERRGRRHVPEVF